MDIICTKLYELVPTRRSLKKMAGPGGRKAILTYSFLLCLLSISQLNRKGIGDKKPASAAMIIIMAR
jgi:hypothetical protein